jgi:uncharacterized protein (DUF58 family)
MNQKVTIPGVDLDWEILMQLRHLPGANKPRRHFVSVQSEGNPVLRRGNGSDNYDIRPWSYGDDVRHIDRNVTAKTGVPHVITRHEELNSRIVYFLDLRSNMNFGTRRALKSVAAVEAMTIMAWRAIKNHNHVGIAISETNDTRFLGWANNITSFSKMLTEVINIHRKSRAACVDNEQSLDHSLEYIEPYIEKSALTIITGLDHVGETFENNIHRLGNKKHVTLLVISDRFERDPLSGKYPFRTRDGLCGDIYLKQNPLTRITPDTSDIYRNLGVRSACIYSEWEMAELASNLERIDDRSY